MTSPPLDHSPYLTLLTSEELAELSVRQALFFEGGFVKQNRTRGLMSAVVLSAGCLAATAGLAIPRADVSLAPSSQESFPSPPTNRTLIYFADEQKTLRPLAVEMGTTPLKIEAIAKSDKRSYVELKGESAATVIVDHDPRFYLFVRDEQNAKPPLIVRMTEKRGTRRVAAMAQKGYTGFAIMSDEIIKPHYRVLSRDGGMIFMEIRPREPLMLGEYAIIGADLQRISTFRVAASPNN